MQGWGKRVLMARQKTPVARLQSTAIAVQMAKSIAPGDVKVTITKKVLGKAPEEQSFVLKDGRKLRTVYELIDELERMNEEVFKHHVTLDRNDFSNWIRDVFEEKPLAEEIRQMKQRFEMQRAILKHLVRELRKATEQKA